MRATVTEVAGASVLVAALLATGGLNGWTASGRAYLGRRGLENASGDVERPIGHFAAASASLPGSRRLRLALERASEAVFDRAGAAALVRAAPIAPLPRLVVAEVLVRRGARTEASSLVEHFPVLEAEALRTLGDAHVRDAGLILSALGRCAPAVPFFEETRLRMEDSKIDRDHGRCLVEAGEFARAISMLEAAVARHPGSRWNRLRLAEAELAANDLPSADATTRELVARAPEFFEGWMLRGRVARQRKDFPSAVDAFERAASLRPGSLAPNLFAAESKLDAGRLEEAERESTELIARSEASFYAWRLRGRVLRARRDLVGAAESFARAAALRADSFGVHFLAAEVTFDLGELDRADAQSSDLVTRWPGSYHSWHLRGRVLRSRRDHARAVDAFERALAIRPEAIGSRLLLAESELDLGHSAVADVVTRELVLRAPTSDHAWFLRGRALRAGKRFAEAVAAFDRALLLRPGELWPRFWRAESLLDAGKLPLADEATRSLVEAQPDFYYGWHLRARVLDGANRPLEAAACYERALALRPENTWLKARIDALRSSARAGGVG